MPTFRRQVPRLRTGAGRARSRRKRSPVRFGLFALAALGGLFLLGAVLIVTTGLGAHPHAADVAIVPGARVDPDGRPSPALAARLDKARQLYGQGLFKAVIVSGGHGREGFDEARVMHDDLVARGVPDSAILVDSAGDTTFDTARDAAALMRAHGWRSALVVTQYFHVARARLALARFGVRPVHGAAADYVDWGDLVSVPREVVGYVIYLFRRA